MNSHSPETEMLLQQLREALAIAESEIEPAGVASGQNAFVNPKWFRPTSTECFSRADEVKNALLRSRSRFRPSLLSAGNLYSLVGNLLAEVEAGGSAKIARLGLIAGGYINFIRDLEKNVDNQVMAQSAHEARKRGGLTRAKNRQKGEVEPARQIALSLAKQILGKKGWMSQEELASQIRAAQKGLPKQRTIVGYISDFERDGLLRRQKVRK